MPVYKLQGPDGKVYTVEGPEGATADQLGAFIAQANDDRASRIAADRERMRVEMDPTKGMSGMGKFWSGAGKAVVDTGRGLGQVGAAIADVVSPRHLNLSDLVVGNKLKTRVDEARDQVEESRKLDAPLMNTGAGMAGNVTGNVAMALAPGAALKGVGTVAAAIPAVSRAAPLINAAGSAMLAPKSIPAALTVGAVQGAVQPSTSTTETLTNTGVGAAASAAVPTLLRAGQVAKSFVDPFYDAGQRKIMGNALRNVAGNQADQAITNMRAAGPLVPGSLPTAAEAAENPGIAALQRAAIAGDPAATNELTLRQVAQSQARNAALDAVAPDKAAAKTAREAATSALYQAADVKPVQITPELEALLERPSMKEALSRASKLAAEKGLTLDPKNLNGQGAHFLKMALDDIASGGPASGIGGNETRAVKDTLTDYLKALETQLPEYGQARTTYASMSRPINQADVVEEIASKGRNFRGDLTPAAYARALRDQTAERVTGQHGATLGKVMEPAQLDTLDAIKNDLLRSDYANTAGRGVGSNTVQNLAYTNMLDKAGIPSMLRNFGPAGVIGNVLGRAGDLAYKRANSEMSQKLATALLDPQEAASLMESSVASPQMQMLIDSLRRGGAAVGAASPYLLNATKQ